MRSLYHILADYQVGLITREESLAAIARVVTRENVAEIMSRTPPEFAEDLTKWASENSAGGIVVLGANLSAEEASDLARSCEVAREAIREWSARETLLAKG